MGKGKTYKFIKWGLEFTYKNPNNIFIWKWSAKENIFKEFAAYYKVINMT